MHVWDLSEPVLNKDTMPLYTLDAIAKTGSRTTCLDVCLLEDRNRDGKQSKTARRSDDSGKKRKKSGGSSGKSKKKKK